MLSRRSGIANAQDSDRFWRVTPPARRSIQRMLNSSAATLALSWEVLRNAPLATKNGGPLCQGVQEIPLSAASSQDILDVLQVRLLSPILSVLEYDCAVLWISPSDTRCVWPGREAKGRPSWSR